MRNRGNSVCPTAFTGHSLGLSPSPISLFLLNLWPISVSGLSFEIVHWVQSHWGRLTHSYTQWDCPNSRKPGYNSAFRTVHPEQALARGSLGGASPPGTTSIQICLRNFILSWSASVLGYSQTWRACNTSTKA